MNGQALSFILVAAFLAGCAAPSRVDHPPADSAPSVRIIVAVPECVDPCREPTVAVAPDGTIYIGDGWPRVYRADDFDDPFVSVSPPPPLGGVEGSEEVRHPQVDVTVHVGPDGRLYVTSFYGAPFVLPNGHGLVHIRASSDRGDTWDTNTIVETGGEGHTLGADRQWLTFATADEVYLTFYRRQCPTELPGFGQPLPSAQACRGELMVARSEDGARTFGALRSVTPLPEWTGNVMAGQPAILTDGTLVIPFYSILTGLERLPRELFVAVSGDRAESFEIHRVTSPGVNVRGSLPHAARGPSDELYVTHGDHGNDNGVFLVTSLDAGRSWSSPLRVTETPSPEGTSSWVLADANGRAHVLYYAVEGDDLSSLWIASIRDGVVSQQRLATNVTGNAQFSAANTHFAHMAWTPANKMLAIWSSAAEARVMLAEIDAERGRHGTGTQETMLAG